MFTAIANRGNMLANKCWRAMLVEMLPRFAVALRLIMVTVGISDVSSRFRATLQNMKLHKNISERFKYLYIPTHK